MKIKHLLAPLVIGLGLILSVTLVLSALSSTVQAESGKDTNGSQSDAEAGKLPIVANPGFILQTCVISLTELHIAGPTIGTIGVDYTFTATVSPSSATLPIIYDWQPSPTGGSGTVLLPTTHVATYTWHTTGPQTITLTASNDCNTLTQTHTITLQPATLLLPLVVRNWPPPSWHPQCVDCPNFIYDTTPRSIAVDSSGHPHVAYGGDHLYHAWHDGSSWQIEVADGESYVGAWASLTLDNDDYPHVSYYDSNNGDLKYAHWDGSAWITETVDLVGGWDSAIALDSSGRPHIAYRYATVGGMDLKYAHWDGSDWRITIIEADISGGSSRDTSLALDGSDYAHIGYTVKDGSSYTLKHAYWDGGQWQIEPVDTADYIGSNSMALSGAGDPHFAYHAITGSTDIVKYASWDGAQWQIGTLAAPSGGADGVSLALDGSDVPHFSYYLSADQTLRHAYRSGSVWQFEMVESGMSAADLGNDATSIALDSTGQPHVFYFLSRHSLLKHAHRDGGGWQVETIEQGGDAGQYSSLALDDDDQPHVSYYDEGQSKIKYAAWDGGQWQVQDVYQLGYQDIDDWTYSIQVSSLALDSAGQPHIVYDYDGFLWVNELRYTYWTGSAWQTRVVESVETGLQSILGGASLALDDADRPHVFYATSDEHRYAYWTGSTWQIETVDSEVGGSNFPTPLALDGAGRPHVAYFDASNLDIKYAYKDTSGWQRQTVESAGYTGAYPSLALDAAGRPHLSYCLVENYKCVELRYAYYDGASWNTETVDDAGDAGYYTSVAVDSSGWPHISYHEGDSDTLKYARWDGAQWQIETVETGNVGRYTSLALDSNGYPHISHYDANLKDLRYTRWGP